VARKIPFDDPQVLFFVRVAYVVVQATILGTYYYVSVKASYPSSVVLILIDFRTQDQAKKRLDYTEIWLV
jgi:Phosphate transport (Pho88)